MGVPTRVLAKCQDAGQGLKIGTFRQNRDGWQPYMLDGDPAPPQKGAQQPQSTVRGLQTQTGCLCI